MPANNQEQIIKAFQQLISERNTPDAKITTKQDEARKEDENRVLEVVSAYTVESIVKGLAELQLDFGNTVGDLSKKLFTELSRLEDLRHAIQVEEQRLAELHHIRIAADAVNILNQQNQEKSKNSEEEFSAKQEKYDNEITQTKKHWQEEKKEYEAQLQESQALIKKEREKGEADYQYNLERDRKIKTDEYTNRKKALEQRLAEKDTELKEKLTEREKKLVEQKQQFDELKVRIDAFPKEIEEAVAKTRAAAIKEVQEEAKLKAELLEKEVKANKEIYSLKIKSLEETIQTQTQQIENLAVQLQQALEQVQDLAVKTVESTKKALKVDVSDAN